ncbi:unnamed protein product [Pleuronectes platessa]|uniref:Uncharacterized protein n=1 Tax=Pleuronectes platessa TaxID=8262 RepID=A0A9N7UXZ1_PLEPL|nr:unnamed protein product [Pleuronectes platessa]
MKYGCSSAYSDNRCATVGRSTVPKTNLNHAVTTMLFPLPLQMKRSIKVYPGVGEQHCRSCVCEGAVSSAVGKLYTLKEKEETEKSSEDPFVRLQQFKPPFLVL